MAADQGSDDGADSDANALIGGSTDTFTWTGAVDRTWDAGLIPEGQIFADGFESGDLSAWSP